MDPNTALVLIDLQNAIVKIPSVTPIEIVLANAAKLVAAFRKAALPIVVVTIDPTSSAKSTVRRDAKSPIPATLSAEALAWGAFYETNLDEELKKRGITCIVLVGVATSRGVESTARVASERGYNIAFAQDAMTDVVATAHENSIKTIFPRIGEVDDTDAIIAVLG